MSDEKIIVRLVQRYTTAQTPLGRWWLDLHFQSRRMLWRWLVAGTQVAKRAFDLVIALLFLVLFSPLFALIALLVKLEDGGALLFAQTRVGKHGRQFKIYKFRSMCLDAEARLQELLANNHHKEGVTFKIKHDPRLTHVGRWLREYSLD